jgi:hypothetical protein
VKPDKPYDTSQFSVSLRTHILHGLVHDRKPFWLRMGNLESRALADEIGRTPIDRPIFVSGLPRSGSTLLIEILARHEQVATHRYKDFPGIFTPFWWNWFLDRMPKTKIAPTERSHQDGLLVTPDSPEALEETLWMAFFPDLHAAGSDTPLDTRTCHPNFESFFRDHIRKLLLARGARRYASKGNYNITRLDYLLKLFPDMRFVMPVRQPSTHIASLMKQHGLFCASEKAHPRSRDYLRRVGHFEFGLDRRTANIGNHPKTGEIVELWANGEEVRGWARYWNLIYRYVANQLDNNDSLRRATTIVRFEDLCQKPAETIGALMEHCELSDFGAVVEHFAGKINYPSYYRASFSSDELKIIDQETGKTASRFGY